MNSPISIDTLIGGGLLLSLSSAVSSKLLSIPSAIFNWAYRRITVVVTLDNTSDFLLVVNNFMHERYNKQYRSIDLSNRQQGFGFRKLWFKYKGRRAFAKQESKEVMAYGGAPVKCNTVTFTFFCFTREIVDEFVKELDQLRKASNSGKVYINDSFGEPRLLGDIPKRSFDSLCYSSNVAEDVKADVDSFLSSKEFYSVRGIPYQRGYLFYGPPGSGKSSISACIANYTSKSVLILSLSNLNDYYLLQCVSKVPSNCILLLEDIDRIGLLDKSGNNNCVSMAGLLNAIDGVFKTPGRIIIATTNHIDRLDPALIRRGRFDRSIEIGYADNEQVSRYVSKFYNKTVICKALTLNTTMADVQESCISNSMPEAALSALSVKAKTLTAGA